MTHPTRARRSDDVAGADDPPIMLVHPWTVASPELVLSVSVPHEARLIQMLTSRSLVGRIERPGPEGGLVRVHVKVGDDPRSFVDVVDCLEITLQLLGRAVFGPLSSPALVDVGRSGRDVVADAVERAVAPLRALMD